VRSSLPVEPTRRLPAAEFQIAVVSLDELLVQRIRDALHRGSVELLDRSADVAGLSPAAADADAIVLAGSRTAAGQRALLRAAAGRFPGVPTVMVASLSSNGVRKALDAGASGVVLEADIEVALPETVRAVAAHQLVVPHRLRHAIRPPLSHREKETLALVARGLTNRQIAGQLFLAESTIKTHLASIFAKLGVSTRSEATALVLDPEENLGLSVVDLAVGAPGPR
jgi:DNA-binding NarL/FixJ family response regulator